MTYYENEDPIVVTPPQALETSEQETETVSGGQSQQAAVVGNEAKEQRVYTFSRKDLEKIAEEAVKKFVESGGIDVDVIVSDIKSTGQPEGRIIESDGEGGAKWTQKVAYSSFASGWPTSGTTKAFCDAINADSNAIEGTAFLGDVTFSDLPASLVNGEIKVEVIAGTGTTNKVIHLVLTSGNVNPYRWEYTYWNNGSNVSDWIAFQTKITPNPTLAGTETDLTGLEIDGVKYKAGGGSGTQKYLHQIYLYSSSKRITAVLFYINGSSTAATVASLQSELGSSKLKGYIFPTINLDQGSNYIKYYDLNKTIQMNTVLNMLFQPVCIVCILLCPHLPPLSE